MDRQKTKTSNGEEGRVKVVTGQPKIFVFFVFFYFLVLWFGCPFFCACALFFEDDQVFLKFYFRPGGYSSCYVGGEGGTGQTTFSNRFLR